MIFCVCVCLVINSDPDHHEHRDHHNEDARHLWDEWSEHGVYHNTLVSSG